MRDWKDVEKAAQAISEFAKREQEAPPVYGTYRAAVEAAIPKHMRERAVWRDMPAGERDAAIVSYLVRKIEELELEQETLVEAVLKAVDEADPDARLSGHYCS